MPPDEGRRSILEEEAMFGTRSLAISVATAVLLAGCGGGGHESKATSEELVSDGPSGCVVQADVDTGPDTAGLGGGACLSGVFFHLFDQAGNEVPVRGSLNIFPADERLRLRQRICRGEIQPFVPSGVGVSSTSSLFFVPDAEACPSDTAPGDLGIELPLARPSQEVSCGEFSRVQIDVVGCDD
jgi:hypothetical protein